MATITPRRNPAAHVFHRRHNTMPRLPMPPLLRPADPGSDRPTDPVGSGGAGDDLTGSPLLQRPDGATDGGPPLLLADLTSPWAYLAHLRLVGAVEEMPSRPVWWAVRAAPAVPLTGLRTSGPARDRVREELEAVRAVALDGEQIPDDVPVTIPHPRPVAAAFAEGVELGRGPEVLALLLRAYWLEGRDIGDPEVLRRLLPSVLVDDCTPCGGDPRREWGYVVSPAREPLSDGAYHLLQRWQQRWLDLGGPGPLTLVDPTGDRVRASAVEALCQEVVH